MGCRLDLDLVMLFLGLGYRVRVQVETPIAGRSDYGQLPRSPFQALLSCLELQKSPIESTCRVHSLRSYLSDNPFLLAGNMADARWAADERKLQPAYGEYPPTTTLSTPDLFPLRSLTLPT